MIARKVRQICPLLRLQNGSTLAGRTGHAYQRQIGRIRRFEHQVCQAAPPMHAECPASVEQVKAGVAAELAGRRAYLGHQEEEGGRAADGSDSQEGKGVSMDAGAWGRPPEAQTGPTRQQQHACLLTGLSSMPGTVPHSSTAARLPAHRDVKHARDGAKFIHSQHACLLTGASSMLDTVPHPSTAFQSMM